MEIIANVIAGLIILWFILAPIALILNGIVALKNNEKIVVKSTGQIIRTKIPELYEERKLPKMSYKYIVRK